MPRLRMGGSQLKGGVGEVSTSVNSKEMKVLPE